MKNVHQQTLWWWLAVLVIAVGGIAWGVHHHVTNTAVLGTQTQGCFSAEQSWHEIGQRGCVTFSVGYTYASSRCNAYLDQYSNYSSGFSVWIPDGCGLGATLLSEYANKTIQVTGTITQYSGAPEIEVTDSSQIQLAQ
jgi:hypothetical protein